MKSIKTSRIKLAVIPTNLAQEEYQIFKNPNLFIYVKHNSFQNSKDAQTFIKRHNQSGNFWGIFLKNGRLIGNCQLSIKEKIGELSYTIAEEFWGYGYASETVKALIEYGFNQCSLSKIIGACVPDNIGSRMVMLKNGMYFSNLKKHVFEKNGTFYDLMYFEKLP